LITRFALNNARSPAEVAESVPGAGKNTSSLYHAFGLTRSLTLPVLTSSSNRHTTHPTADWTVCGTFDLAGLRFHMAV